MMIWSVVTGHGDHKSMKDWSFLDNELYAGYISWYWYLADSCMYSIGDQHLTNVWKVFGRSIAGN